MGCQYLGPFREATVRRQDHAPFLEPADRLEEQISNGGSPNIWQPHSKSGISISVGIRVRLNHHADRIWF